MKYPYEFFRDHLEMLRVKLPGEIELFADFIEDISTEQKADEYIKVVENVLNGLYQDFEIQLNATSVLIKKDMTVLEHLFTYEEPYENEMETEQFKELMLIWKNKIPERFKKNEN
ncbi:tRNA-Val4 [Peribacillus frigoritolerans]|uniref:tRNA-Val4 n=1 Tax=Peribacillus frigoritolerans TaxID=450367 RepID=UPI00222FF11B|nr:tRNA-Val4 [Peribacillus frigoritolerans]MDM5312620.1 tRNA-Val4 [Peribacillus frigoritolerans]UZD46013.1 tRNA-Val4 [Peribacillus frigoritolerans]